MDRQIVLEQEPPRIMGLVEDVHDLPAALGRRTPALDPGIGRKRPLARLDRLDQTGDVFRQQPVVVVEEEQELTLGRVQAQVGRCAASQTLAAGDQTERTVATARRVEFTGAPNVDQHDLDVGIGLGRDRVERLGQGRAPHGADQDRDERMGSGVESFLLGAAHRSGSSLVGMGQWRIIGSSMIHHAHDWIQRETDECSRATLAPCRLKSRSTSA